MYYGTLRYCSLVRERVITTSVAPNIAPPRRNQKQPVNIILNFWVHTANISIRKFSISNFIMSTVQCTVKGQGSKLGKLNLSAANAS
jgi:hypothetical protein